MPAVLLKLYQPGGKTVYPYPSILSILVKMNTEKKKWHLLFQQQIFLMSIHLIIQRLSPHERSKIIFINTIKLLRWPVTSITLMPLVAIQNIFFGGSWEAHSQTNNPPDRPNGLHNWLQKV